VNANGTVTADNHNSLLNGWASLTFNPVNATAIRIGFSNAAPINFNHYRVYELEVYGPSGGGGGTGGGSPSISISPANLDFGSVATDAPKDLTLQVTNTGTATLSVSSVSGTNALFTMRTSLLELHAIAPGATVPVTIRFAPAAAGPQTGTLRFASNDPLKPIMNVGVTGSGAASGGGAASGPDLLQNGGAEGSAAIPGCGPATTIPGWTTDGNVAVCSYTLGGGYPVATDPGPPNRGQNFFGGGFANLSTMNQIVALASSAAQIDTGGVPFTLSGYLGGYGGQDDRTRMTVVFLDGSGRTLGSPTTIGPVTNADRANVTGMLPRSANGTVPVGARSARVTVEFIKSGGDSNDGYADGLSLRVGR
jgi:hypothetical protein